MRPSTDLLRKDEKSGGTASWRAMFSQRAIERQGHCMLMMHVCEVCSNKTVLANKSEDLIFWKLTPLVCKITCTHRGYARGALFPRVVNHW